MAATTFPATAPVGFQSTIKPYFTACSRTHMLNVLNLDPWDPGAAVQLGRRQTPVIPVGCPKPVAPKAFGTPPRSLCFLAIF